MSYEIEQRRNEWVAQQLGIAEEGVYKDDNCFVPRNSETGETAAFITIASNGDEVLMLADGSHGWAVPHDLRLGLVW